MPNPYQNLPPTRFWKSAVAELEPRSVMPIRSNPFPIEQGATIATAGSCFAQEVGEPLRPCPA